MTRFAVQYLSEESNGVSTSETVVVSADNVEAAKDQVIERAGAFINILSVDVSTDGDTRPGLIKTMELASTVKVKTEKPVLVKEPKVAKVKVQLHPGEKKVTASSQVRERIILAKTAGLTLEQACDDIVLWCMTNLAMSKGTARGYTTSQWLRVK